MSFLNIIKNKIKLRIGIFIPKYKKDTLTYWESRYRSGDNSGVGSYGLMAEYKAEVINQFVENSGIITVIEFGSGDGNQLRYFNFQNYLGFDISATAVDKCKKLFRSDNSKIFKLLGEWDGQMAEIVISLEVIFHLIEDKYFNDHMEKLFLASEKYVVIFSSNKDINPPEQAKHVKHRKFTDWVEKNRPDFDLIDVKRNKYPDDQYDFGSFSDFYFYKRAI
ncbi:hypothetical protein [Cyclobacterium plantarum]|uniref:hypothetical protein n=1 Tax=Cyclobacterium plantarum TaxID=2716263 RepID=UPI003F72E06B